MPASKLLLSPQVHSQAHFSKITAFAFRIRNMRIYQSSGLAVPAERWAWTMLFLCSFHARFAGLHTSTTALWARFHFISTPFKQAIAFLFSFLFQLCSALAFSALFSDHAQDHQLCSLNWTKASRLDYFTAAAFTYGIPNFLLLRCTSYALGEHSCWPRVLYLAWSAIQHLRRYHFTAYLAHCELKVPMRRHFGWQSFAHW